MIPFFRKIRKTLADDNKPLKYLRYAIGEIVLVVIGILFALQINSWNQNRLERIEEIEILKSLHSDFFQTKSKVLETIKLQSRVVDYCSKMIRLMIEKNNFIYNDSFADYFFSGTLAYWRIEPVNGTYEALIGSGKTGILQNQDLSRLLAEFSAKASELQPSLELVHNRRHDFFVVLQDFFRSEEIGISFDYHIFLVAVVDLENKALTSLPQ